LPRVCGPAEPPEAKTFSLTGVFGPKIAFPAKKLQKTPFFGLFSLYIACPVPYDDNDSRTRGMLRNPVNIGSGTLLAFPDRHFRPHIKQGGSMATTTRLTQTQLVRGLAEAGEVTNKQARTILDSLSSMAVSEVKKNGVFVLPGIGRLVRVDRKARMGRNPATGEAIKIPAKKVVKFRVAKAAKDAIVPPKKPKA
jgi:DNA-binding protein HU-beta